MELTIILKGSDFPPDTTVSKSVILHEHDGKKDVISSEDFQPFTFESDNDELTIKHKIQVPAVG